MKERKKKKNVRKANRKEYRRRRRRRRRERGHSKVRSVSWSPMMDVVFKVFDFIWDVLFGFSSFLLLFFVLFIFFVLIFSVFFVSFISLISHFQSPFYHLFLTYMSRDSRKSDVESALSNTICTIWDTIDCFVVFFLFSQLPKSPNPLYTVKLKKDFIQTYTC